MWFALGVLDEIGLAFEPFGALRAVPLSESRKIFRCLCVVILLQVLLRLQVCVDLVQIPDRSMAPRLALALAAESVPPYYQLRFRRRRRTCWPRIAGIVMKSSPKSLAVLKCLLSYSWGGCRCRRKFLACASGFRRVQISVSSEERR